MTLQLTTHVLLHWRTWCRQTAHFSPFGGCLCCREEPGKISCPSQVAYPVTDHAGIMRPSHLSPIQANSKRSFSVLYSLLVLYPNSTSLSFLFCYLLLSTGMDPPGAFQLMVSILNSFLEFAFTGTQLTRMDKERLEMWFFGKRGVKKATK